MIVSRHRGRRKRVTQHQRRTRLDHHFPYNEIAPDTVNVPPRKERVLEVSVILFLILPSMILSLFVSQLGELQFLIMAVSTILRDLGLLFLVLFLIWRNREPVRRLGWRRGRAGTEVLWGIALFIPVFYGAALLQALLQQLGLSAPQQHTPAFQVGESIAELTLAVLLVTVVAVSEETLFRGYLILRFTQIANNRWTALIVSSAIFALGHGYAGNAAIVTTGAIGFALGLVYLWRRSLVAPTVIHFLQNLVSLVVIPLLGQ
ncbi:MAG: CPBP family intramembrane metalloprotease [Chitinivibrionales bacterium]|nr:CPBP family intramembrane metalloprotease [Chitinivibrionales bacterium]